MSQLKICPQCGTEYELDQKFCPKDGTTLRLQGGQTGDLVGAIIADRYNVIKKLGEGGMGTVYLAEHVKMGRKSAIKVMNPGMVSDADAISRFNREASNASRINHPNVAAVYDFGETSDGLIYLAMEFVEGPSLTKVIEECGSLPALRAAEITRQAAEALAVAHDMGIVHRDLKPDNIMLAKGRDGADVVKVVDFGIAKAAEGENQKVTKTGLVVGTPEYMSPEQLAGDKLDGRSDTYSLALVAFAMMTGKLPFPAETIQESMIKRLTDEPQPLAAMKPDVTWPESVQTVMSRALERDVAGRFQTASEFGRALYKAVEAMPESAATAFTAVMTPSQIPVPAGATKGIPATRVNQATPRTPAKAVAAPPAAKFVETKSRAPMIAAAAVVVLAIGGFGIFKVMSGTTEDGTVAPTGTQLSQGVAETPPVSLTSVLEQVAVLIDPTKVTEANARQALARLDSIAPLAQTRADSVHVLFLRATSHLALAGEAKDAGAVARETKAGCDILRDSEGKFRQTQFEERVSFFLYGKPQQGLPAAC